MDGGDVLPGFRLSLRKLFSILQDPPDDPPKKHARTGKKK